MPNVGSSLRTKLLSYAGVSTLVGQRMYPDALKQNATLPAIVYRRISTARDHDIGDVTRLAHSRFEIICVAASRAAADSVADAVRTSGICAFAGPVDSIVFLGTEIDSGEEYGDDPPTDGSQVYRYWTSFDLMVHYQEAS
jgi:hypothetical protein